MFEGDHRGGVASFSPDGQLLTFNRRAPDTGLDLWVRPLNGTPAPHPFLGTRFTEVGSKFSPDGRWISYVSDESGQYEVYVRPYPGPGGKWQVSTQGGGETIWSRDGKELFYRNGNKWMVVNVNLTPEFKAETPRVLFEGPYVASGVILRRDAGRPAVPGARARRSGTAPVTHLNVVLNWFEEVKRKASVVPSR